MKKKSQVKSKVKPKVESKKKTAQDAPQATYHVTLQLGNTLVEGTGASLLEALQAMQKPTKITTKGVLYLTDGQRKGQRFYNIPQAKRLFYPMAQYLWAKQLTQLLK